MSVLGAAARSAKNQALFYVYMTVAIDLGGEFAVVPVLGRLALDLGVPVGTVGLLFSGTAAAMMVSNVWLPAWSDRYGRRNAMLISLVGSTVGYTGQALSTTFGSLLLFRIVQGLFGGVPPVALAYVTDLFTPTERAPYLASIQAIVSSAFVCGAVVGGGLGRFGLQCPMIFSAAVSFLGLIVGYRNLKDPEELLSLEEKLHIQRRECEADERAPRRTEGADGVGSRETSALVASPVSPPPFPSPLGEASSARRQLVSPQRSSSGATSPWRDPRALTIGLVSFLNNICFCGMSVLLPLLLNRPDWGLQRHALATQLSGFAFAFIGVVQAIAMMSLFLTARRVLGLLRTCFIGSVIFGIGVFMISWPTDHGPGNFLSLCWIPLFLAATGNGLCRPAYTIYLTLIAPKSRVGETMALIDVTLNAAMVVGPQLTLVYSRYGERAAFLAAGGAAIIQAAIVAVLIATEGRGRGTGKHGSELRAIPKDEFVAEVQALLFRILEERNYSLEKASAQLIVREILDQAFPYLRPGGPKNRDHMHDVFQLMKALGHDDLAGDVQLRFGFADHDEAALETNHGASSSNGGGSADGGGGGGGGGTNTSRRGKQPAIVRIAAVPPAARGALV